MTVQWFSEFSLNKLSWRFHDFLDVQCNKLSWRFFTIFFFFSSCFSFFSFSFSLFLSIRHFVPYWITSLRSWFQTKSASLRRFAAYLSTLLRSWFHKKCLLPKGIFFSKITNSWKLIVDFLPPKKYFFLPIAVNYRFINSLWPKFQEFPKEEFY